MATPKKAIKTGFLEFTNKYELCAWQDCTRHHNKIIGITRDETRDVYVVFYNYYEFV